MKNNSKCFIEIVVRLNDAEKKQQRMLESIIRAKEKLNKAVIYNNTLRLALKANKKSQNKILQSEAYKTSLNLPKKRIRELVNKS